MFCSPNKCRDILDPILAEIARPDYRYREEGRFEQAMLNYFAQASGKLELVDHTWNFIRPELENEQPMHKWVYHFTGHDSEAVKHRVKDFDWRVGANTNESNPTDAP
jgi:hypothetical protein